MNCRYSVRTCARRATQTELIRHIIVWLTGVEGALSSSLKQPTLAWQRSEWVACFSSRAPSLAACEIRTLPNEAEQRPDKAALLKLLDRFLTRPDDRALFNLPTQ